jgi:hypothetical protein
MIAMLPTSRAYRVAISGWDERWVAWRAAVPLSASIAGFIAATRDRQLGWIALFNDDWRCTERRAVSARLSS